MNSTAISIHILIYFFVTCQKHFPHQHSKIKGINVGKIWFAQDVIDGLAITKTFCCENMPGAGHGLVSTGNINNLY